MTNSLFEQGETKMERHKEMEKESVVVVLSETSAELQRFGRKLLNYKDKGSRDFSGYSSRGAFGLDEEEKGGLIMKNNNKNKKILQI